MLRKTAALRGRILILSAIALLMFSAVFAAACGDDDADPAPQPTATPTSPAGETPTEPTGETNTPPPSGETPTPTPEVNDPRGFEDALRDFEAELQSGGLDAIVARLLLQDYTCKASDLEPGLGQPECKTAGEVIRAIEVSSWRSSGGLRKVDGVVAFLQQLNGDIRDDTSDEWGAGEPDIYAFDSSVNRAVLTMRVDCQPQHQCVGGTQRVVVVLDFEYVDGRWKIDRIMNAFVLFEEFLDLTDEASGYFPEWERLS